MPEVVSKEEVLQFLESEKGFLLKKHSGIKTGEECVYLYFTNGLEDRTFKVVVKDKKEIEELKEKVRNTLKSLYGRLTYSPERPNKEERKVQPTKLTVNTSLRELDKTFAKQIMAYAKRQSWFAEIIEELGMTTFFMIMQLAKIPPEAWYEKISEYKDDPKKFRDFADKYMVALFEAREDAEKLLETREKWYYCIAERESLRAKLMEYTKLLKDAITQLNACTSMLSQKQLQRYTMWTALRKMSEAQPRIEIEKDK